jgi:hypothetical protein
MRKWSPLRHFHQRGLFAGVDDHRSPAACPPGEPAIQSLDVITVYVPSARERYVRRRGPVPERADAEAEVGGRWVGSRPGVSRPYVQPSTSSPGGEPIASPGDLRGVDFLERRGGRLGRPVGCRRIGRDHGPASRKTTRPAAAVASVARSDDHRSTSGRARSKLLDEDARSATRALRGQECDRRSLGAVCFNRRSSGWRWRGPGPPAPR